MRKSLIFPVILIPGLLACGSNNRDSNEDLGPQGAQTAFDLTKADFGLSQDDSGNRLVFLTRRPGQAQVDESFAKLASYDRTRSRANRLNIRESKDLLAGDDSHDLSLAELSPDGEKILMAVRNSEASAVVLSSFDGSRKALIELSQLLSVESLAWDAESKLFAVGGMREGENGQATYGIWLGLLQDSEDGFELSVKLGPKGRQPRVHSDGAQLYLNYWRDEGQSRLFERIEISHDGETISLDDGSKEQLSRSTRLAQKELFYADSKRVYFSETNTDLRVRERWGNRAPNEEGIDNIGRLTITQSLSTINMGSFELAEDFDFDVYRSYEPASLQSVDSARSGDLILVVGSQVVACESLTIHGNMMLLVHTANQTAVPLVPTTDENQQTNGLVSELCDQLDESRPAINQPLDLRVRAARISELEPGYFQIAYESRVLDDLEVFLARFRLPNLEDAGLDRSNLEIEDLVIENISNNNRLN